MKKILLSILILFAASAQAQETYSVALQSAANVAKLDLGRVQRNQTVCASLNLAANCTQAQACVAANVAGGSSCTLVDANNANVRIYANTQNGREAFITLELVKSELETFVRIQAEQAKTAFRNFCAIANQAKEDAICLNIGLSAGCGVCK